MEEKYIAIDIGHGEDTFDIRGSKGLYKDGIGYEEHHSNAKIGLRLEKRLRELGFKTILGQPAYKEDVPLANRTNLYNKEKVDFVVSIHSNAGVKTANGACAFYWYESAYSKKMADLIMKHYKDTVKGVDVFGKGVIPSEPKTWTDFHMCRVPEAPSVLCEFGFMTNENDFKYIFGTGDFHNQCAETIVKAICDYYKVKYIAPNAPKPVETPNQMNNGDYKVQAGDTFYSIANKLRCDVAVLQRMNPTIKPKALKVGMYIKLPKVVSGIVVAQAPKSPKFILPEGVYKKGAKGEAVKQIQNALNALNFNCGKADGIFGAGTEEALKRFQKVYDAYHVDGVYGSRVQTKMNRLLNK